MNLRSLDQKAIELSKRAFIPMARFSVFVVYFWFGILKIFDLSPASPLAQSLVERTIGLGNFRLAFIILGVFECLVGLLFLIPKATRVALVLLFAHMAVVCAPLVLLPSYIWTKAFVPTLEGQYIIKNLVVIAAAIGIAAQQKPLAKKSAR